MRGLYILFFVSEDDWQRLRRYRKAAKAYNSTWKKFARDKPLTEKETKALAQGIELYRAGKLERPIGGIGFRVSEHEVERVFGKWRHPLFPHI